MKVTYQTDPKVVEIMAKSARAIPEGERDLMQTLMALGVPLDRAASLVSTEMSQAVKGSLMQYAELIREGRAARLPEGSEARRRLNMVADMLDPTTEDSWDYRTGKEETDDMVV